MTKLRDVLPPEALSYVGHQFIRHLDREVVKVHLPYEGDLRWPGQHKNVVAWWELEGGKAVGWNESVIRGWGFPVIQLKK